MRKHETAVCRTARTVVWEVGKREVGGKHFYQRLPPTRLASSLPRQDGYKWLREGELGIGNALLHGGNTIILLVGGGWRLKRLATSD